MKGNKFNVIVYNEDGSIRNSKEFKSYQDIANTLNIDYYTVREINRITEGQAQKKFLHSHIKELMKTIKIETIKQTFNLNIENM